MIFYQWFPLYFSSSCFLVFSFLPQTSLISGFRQRNKLFHILSPGHLPSKMPLFCFFVYVVYVAPHDFIGYINCAELLYMGKHNHTISLVYLLCNVSFQQSHKYTQPFPQLVLPLQEQAEIKMYKIAFHNNFTHPEY